jgi:uncharacterized protein
LGWALLIGYLMTFHFPSVVRRFPRTRCWALVAFAALSLAASVAHAQSPSQSLDQLAGQIRANGYVSDFAGVLSQAAKDQLTALCTEVDQKAQAQIAVVIIKSLDGQSIDQYAPDLFAKVGVGDKRTSRGVMILLAEGDRQYRIEVGYGLEPILPDGKVGGFGREAVPYLKQGNFDAAVLLMTRRVADVIAADKAATLSGAPAAPPPDQSQGPHSFLAFLLSLPPFVILLIIFFVINLLVRLFRPRGSASRGGGWWIGPMMGGGMGGGGFGGGGGGGFGGFGGGMSGGGGASGGW